MKAIEFYCNWCPYCLSLSRKTFSKESVYALGQKV